MAVTNAAGREIITLFYSGKKAAVAKGGIDQKKKDKKTMTRLMGGPWHLCSACADPSATPFGHLAGCIDPLIRACFFEYFLVWLLHVMFIYVSMYDVPRLGGRRDPVVSATLKGNST